MRGDAMVSQKVSGKNAGKTKNICGFWLNHSWRLPLLPRGERGSPS